MNRKWMAFLAAVPLICFCIFCGPAGAEGEMPLSDFFVAGEKLLLKTENVTISGEASFTLDGELFRAAKGLYIQDGTDAWQEITLYGAPGTQENGYAVADLSGNAYAIEARFGTEYVFRTTNPVHRSILRGTVNQEQLLALGRQTAEQLDLLLGPEILTAPTENGTHIHLEIPKGDSYPLTDVALNLFWQYGIDHFYYSGYQDEIYQVYTDPEDYSTLTRGLVLTTRSLALESLSLDLEQDGQGRITSADGEMTLKLTAYDQRSRTLSIQFRVQAEDYGTSSVTRSEIVQQRITKAFEKAPGVENESESSPMGEESETGEHASLNQRSDEKNVFESSPEGEESGTGGNVSGAETVSAENNGWVEPTAEPDIEAAQVPDFRSAMTPWPLTDDDSYIAYAREAWTMDYFGLSDLDGYEWKVTDSEHGYKEVWGQDPQDTPIHYLYMEIGPDGWIYSLKNAVSDVDQAFWMEDSRTDSMAFEHLSRDVTAMLNRFIEALNPGATLKALAKLGGGGPDSPMDLGRNEELFWGDKVFMTHFSVPNEAEETRMKFMVQVMPEVRVVYFNELNTMFEGGNG